MGQWKKTLVFFGVPTGQKDKRTEGQKDKRTKGQKYKNTKLKNYKRTKGKKIFFYKRTK